MIDDTENIYIDQTALIESVTFLEQFLTSKLPQYDFSPGTANRDIAINSIAAVVAYLRTEVSTIKGGLTLLDLKNKTDASSQEMVDAILSDFFVTRHRGEVARGPVALFFSTNNIGTLTVKKEHTFTRNGQDFSIDGDVLFITGSDLQKNTNNSGTVYYTYNMSLVADTKGVSGRVPKGRFESWALSSPFLYQVEVLEDFSGGEDVEDSQDLIKRSEKALTVKNLVTDTAIYTVLMDTFSFLKNVASVGMHDPEMIRDLLVYTSGITNLTIHRGNMTDVYGKFPITFRKEESFVVAQHSVSGVIKTSIKLPQVPVYKVHSIIDTANNNTEVTHSKVVADIATYLSGAQEYFLLVSDDLLGASLKVTYDHVTNYQEVQDFVTARSNRTIVSDTLVKAQFPLYLSFEVPYYSQVDVAETDIKNAVQDFIHSGAVEGNLYVASIVEKITETFGVTMQLPFVVTGVLLLPNGEEMTIEYKDRIRTPNKYMLTPGGEYLPLFEGESNANNYAVGVLADLQISDTTTRFVLDKDSVAARRIG